jgi:transposase
LSKKDIIRCLKRMIARELYYVLQPVSSVDEPALAA